MADTSLGFKYVGRISGGAPTIQSITTNATATLSVGDMVTETGGKLVLAATGGSKFMGVIRQTAAGTANVTKYEVIVDPDAIYSVYDNNARVLGATLDIAGATGAQTVAASSNKEFVVYATKLNNIDPTLVVWNTGKHLMNTAQ